MSEPSASELLVGQLLDGRYKVVREIAVGGMSTVYEATHVKIGRTVAIKVLHREMAGDADAVARFLQEARAVGTFGHPNIVASTDFGELEGHLPYLVLEYLKGQTLSHEIRTNGALPADRAVRIALQVASALEAAHARGVVHRDLTSDNVFLADTEDNPEHVKVLDFGISKFLTTTDLTSKTRRGIIMGTPEFMAPEQISEPDAVDARTDVYALGVIMHHMLAGEMPFGRLPLQALLAKIVFEPPPSIERPEIPAELRAIVTKALAKKPDDRFARMHEMAAEIEQLGLVAWQMDTHSGRVVMPASPSGTGRREATARLRLRTGSVPIMVSPSPSPSASASASPSPSPPASPPQPAIQPASAGGRNPRRGMLFAMLGLSAAALSVGALSRLRNHPAALPSPPPMAIVQPIISPPPATPPPPPTPTPAEPQTVRLSIRSPARLARVTLRGRTHLLPFAQDIAPGGQPEVVELTAPGRAGKRMWITFDRPIELSADMRPGRGVVEATEEETLIALGQRPVDDRTAGKRSAATRHAKDGRTRPEAQPQPAPRPAPDLPPPPAGAPAASTPAPALVAPAAPAPANPQPRATNPAKLAVAPAAATAAAMRGVDPAKTQALVRSHLPEIERCYQRGKMDDADLKGRVTVQVAIAASGAVTSATIESSTLGNGSVQSCILNAVKSWKFPPPTGGAAVISYPFNLR